MYTAPMRKVTSASAFQLSYTHILVERTDIVPRYDCTTVVELVAVVSKSSPIISGPGEQQQLITSYSYTMGYLYDALLNFGTTTAHACTQSFVGNFA